MSDRIERFKKRKAILKKNQSLPLIRGLVDQELVDHHLNQGIDKNKAASLQYTTSLTPSLEVTPPEVKALLSELKESFNKNRLEQSFEETKQGVLSSIVGPFGLGKILSSNDKKGGNVDTVHNVRERIYATEEEKKRFEQIDKYNKSISQSVHKNDKYINTNKEYSKSQKTNGVSDAYSHETMGTHDKRDLDHVISAKNIHEDAGRVLAEKRTENLANTRENLVPTSATINRSKQAKTPSEFVNYLKEGQAKRQKKINSLEGKSERLSEKEQKELSKLRKLEKADHNKLIEAEKVAKKALNKEVNQYYTSKKFIKNTVVTGVNEGVQMGAQQAFGILLTEFFSSALTEIKEAFKNGLEGDSLYKMIKTRLARVGNNIIKKWREAAGGLADGFISGFFSNLVTTAVNMFITTGKRVVRMIREGFFSILKAVKFLLFPPENMTFAEIAHEATKLVLAGGVVIAGVALEEFVEKSLSSIPFLTPIAPLVTAAIVGSLTAIAMSVVTYLFDRLDCFGAIKIQETKFTIDQLDKNIDRKLDQCESISAEINEYLDKPLLLPS